jgi:threonine aldolase
MREAMKGAIVGDDVYREDPTVNELQRHVAQLLGKEDAVLFPSGSMANLAAIGALCGSCFSSPNRFLFAFALLFCCRC